MPRRNQFENRELRDMLCVYAQTNYNSCAASRRYIELYPNRVRPNRKLFQQIYNQLGETGTFTSKNLGGRPKTVQVEQEEEIMVRIADNPRSSTRRLEVATGISKSSISRFLRTEKLYPFHFTPVQELLPNDLPLRLEFCHFLLNKMNADLTFIKNILFTDEAIFTRRGVFNCHNNHFYDLDNPHLQQATHFQSEFSINIWCGIIDNYLIGPFELPRRLNGAEYLQFLENDLNILLDDVPLNIRQKMWFMQDGAPPHFSLAVRNHLNERFPNRWIGRGSIFPWPPRSPDINPLDFYLWGHMKSLVYKEEISTRDELLGKIQEATNLIRNQEDIFPKLRYYLRKAIVKCIEANGDHFQHLLN